MNYNSLGVIEQKVLGALMILAGNDKVVRTTVKCVAETIGYKRSGGSITLALRILELNDFIVRISPHTYKILI